MVDYSEQSTNQELDRLRQYKEAELAVIADAEARRYEIEKQYAELTSRLKQNSLAAELKAYQSAAGSMAKLLGLGIKEQAMVMIPFEIAEATMEMGKFLATKDPSHLAASLKHALAVKQYADAAKTSASADSGSSGAEAGKGSTGAGTSSSGSENIKPPSTSTVIVNIGDGVVTDPKSFARQLIEGLNEAYRDNVNIEFAN
jgi:hypothetical protein